MEKQEPTAVKDQGDLSAMNTNPFSRAFKGLEALFDHNTTWAIILLVVGALGSIAQFIPSGPSDSSSVSQNTTPTPDLSPGVDAAIIALIIAMLILGVFLAALFSAYVSGISTYVAWKTSRKETVGIGEAFSAVTSRIWTILAVEVLTFLKIFGGMLLFIIPGIRAALRYQMVLFPVFDEGLNARNSMQRIKKLSKGHLIELFGIGTVGAIIPILGTLLQMGGELIMYPQLKQLENYDGPKPKVHWLNYIGFLLLALLLGGIFLLIAIFAAVSAN